MSCARWDATAVVADCLYVLGGGWGGVGLGAIAEGALGWGRLVGWLVLLMVLKSGVNSPVEGKVVEIHHYLQCFIHPISVVVWYLFHHQ